MRTARRLVPGSTALGCGSSRCCTGGAVQSDSRLAAWAERRVYREQLPSRDHRHRGKERLIDGTPLGSAPISQELRLATSQVTSLGRQRKWQEALAVYAAFPEPDAVLRSSMVDACAKSQQLEAAQQIFAEMPQKNLGAYTSLINLFGRLRRVRDAENLMRKMQEDSIEPDGFVYSSIVMAYGGAGDVDSALRIFRQRQQAFPDQPSKVAFGAIMSACSKNGELELAKGLLSELEAAQLSPDVEHFTSLMTACVRRRDEASARETFAEMRQRGLKPDIVAYSTLIACISGQDAVAKADAVLAEMEQQGGLVADAYVFDAMLSVAMHAGDKDRFHSLLAEMDRRGLSKTQATHRKIHTMEERQSWAARSPAAPSAGSLPPGWHATMDPTSGRHYFWNEKDPATTTTWERPSL